MADSQAQILRQPREVQRFDLPAFDQAIETHGARLTHYRAVRCPHGLMDVDAARRTRHDHVGCSNGFIYQKAGDLYALASGNSLVFEPGPQGTVPDVPVSVTFARRYIGGDCRKPVRVAPWDRFVIAGQDGEALLAEHSQLFQCSASGKDRLEFPVTEVLLLIDSGDRTYGLGDFEVRDGVLVWGASRPPFDAETGGAVCTIRYTYRPAWYLWQLSHDLRAVRSPVGRGEQGWQAGVLRREIWFDSEGGDPAENPGPRRHAGPDEY